MQNSVWKLTALAGVVGIGFLVVLQAQRGLSLPGLSGPNGAQTAAAPGSADERSAAELGDAVPFDAFAEPATAVQQENPADFGEDHALPPKAVQTPPASRTDPFGPPEQFDRRDDAGLEFRIKQRSPATTQSAAAPEPLAADPFAPEPRNAAPRAAETSPANAVRTVGADQRDRTPSGLELASGEELDFGSDLFGEAASPSEPAATAADAPGPQFGGEPAPFPADIEAEPMTTPPPRKPRPVPGNPFAFDPLAEPEPQRDSVPVRPAGEKIPLDDRVAESERSDGPDASTPGRREPSDPPIPAADEELELFGADEGDSVPVPQTLPESPKPPEPGTPTIADDPFAMDLEQPDANESKPSAPRESKAEESQPSEDAEAPTDDQPELLPVPEEPVENTSEVSPAATEPDGAPSPELEPVPSTKPLPRQSEPGRVRLDETQVRPLQNASPLPVISPKPKRTGATPPIATGSPGDAKASEPAVLEPDDVHDGGTVRSDIPQGSQQPRLKIEKRAPPHAILGQPLIYEIHVKNFGLSPAYRVVVEDRIPKGTELTGSIPRAELVNKALVWKFSELKPGEEQLIKVCVVPTTEGQVGSVATVNFVAEVASRTMITAPKLELLVNGPKQVPLGAPVRLHFRVTNTGSGDATGVFIRSILAEGLQHPGGNDLEYEVGQLPPGKSREVTLALTAAKAGEVVSSAVVTADGGLNVEHQIPLEVIGDRLLIARTGPKHRYVGRTAEYTNTITNDGPRAVPGATVVETIPPGMEFVGATGGGTYDAQQRTVSWSIDTLGPKENRVLKVTLKCVEAGTHQSLVRANTANGAHVDVQSETEVEGFAALGLEVPTVEGPVEVGEQVALRILARNRGTLPSTNVALTITLPAELELIRVEGPAKHAQSENRITFEPVATIDGGTEAAFDLFLKARQPGNARVSVEIASEQLKKPLSREEIVYVLEPGQ